MAVNVGDISLVFSGGLSNSDPSQSIGGDASIYDIPGGINNLFEDIDSPDTDTIEYRAFYIFNDNSTSSISNTKIWIESQVYDGAFVELGVLLEDEIQQITITPIDDITSGTFEIEINYNVGPTPTTETTDPISWDADLGTLAQNIQDALNNLNKFSTIEVSSDGGGVFSVTFSDKDGNKSQPSLEITNNLLISSGDAPAIAVDLIQQGSPINTVAVNIGFPNIAPNGITFTSPDAEENSLLIGQLQSYEGFPVWIKRTTPAESLGVESDGFTLRFKAKTP